MLLQFFLNFYSQKRSDYRKTLKIRGRTLLVHRSFVIYRHTVQRGEGKTSERASLNSVGAAKRNRACKVTFSTSSEQCMTVALLKFKRARDTQAKVPTQRSKFDSWECNTHFARIIN